MKLAKSLDIFRYRDDYDEKLDPAPTSKGGNDGFVKPAAPVSSVYARPRAPPKIRRPVPVSEQNKYAYNSTAAGVAPATSSAAGNKIDILFCSMKE